MAIFHALGAIALSLVVVYQSYVTHYLLLNLDAGDSKRMPQLLLIWTIPFIGAWLVLQVIKVDAEPITWHDSSKDFEGDLSPGGGG